MLCTSFAAYGHKLYPNDVNQRFTYPNGPIGNIVSGELWNRQAHQLFGLHKHQWADTLFICICTFKRWSQFVIKTLPACKRGIMSYPSHILSEHMSLQRAWMHPVNFQNLTTDGQIQPCAELAPMTRFRRINIFFGHPSVEFEVHIHTNDSSFCQMANLFIPLNRLSPQVMHADTCDTPLEYTMCSLESSSPSCVYYCDWQKFEYLDSLT